MPNARNFGSSCGQLVFSTPSGNSADVYVNDGNWPGLDTNKTLLIVPKGTVRSLPDGALRNVLDVTRYYVSGADTDKIVVTAIDAN